MAKKKKNKKRFKSRSQEVLKTVYEKRDERSRSTGKSVWRSDSPLPEFNPERHKDYELFLAPLGWEPRHGFHRDLSIHYNTGPAFDAYVCMQIYRNNPCFRCENQAVGTQEWRAAGGKKKSPYPDNLKVMFPWDRAGYVLLDMTSEESLDKGWQLWAAPKEKVHAEIAKKMHNKRKGTYIDISDFEKGRIVALEVGERKTDTGDFPTYSVDFEELEEEIPEEYQDHLSELCEEAEEAGINLDHGGLIDYFLHFPDYEEVKQSHLAGMDRKEIPEEEEGEEEEEAAAFDEDEVREELDEMSKFKIKKYAKKTWGLSLDISGKDKKEEIIDNVIEQLTGGEGRPECFGNYADFEECEDCEHDEECSDETEESTE
jgi:hypothetical protein